MESQPSSPILFSAPLLHLVVIGDFYQKHWSRKPRKKMRSSHFRAIPNSNSVLAKPEENKIQLNITKNNLEV